MKVTVVSSMLLEGAFRPEIKIDSKKEKATLRDLLKELSYVCQTIEFIRNGELGSDIDIITINGTERYNLDIELNDSDEVTVFADTAPLAGG